MIGGLAVGVGGVGWSGRVGMGIIEIIFICGILTVKIVLEWY